MKMEGLRKTELIRSSSSAIGLKVNLKVIRRQLDAKKARISQTVAMKECRRRASFLLTYYNVGGAKSMYNPIFISFILEEATAN